MKNDYKIYIDELCELEVVLNNLAEEEIQFKPAGNKWNVREIMAHLADTEIQAYIRYRSVLCDIDPYLVFYDQDRWSVELKHYDIPVSESFSLFKIIRFNNYNLICSLSEDQLNKEGIHSTRGKVTIRGLINAYIGHLEKHYQQIKRNIEECRNVNVGQI